MKIIINETQLRQIFESEKKDRLLTIPANDFVENWQSNIDKLNRNKFNGFELEGDFDVFRIYDTDDEQKLANIIEKMFNDVVIVTGSIEIGGIKIKSLGNLKSVGRDLDLSDTLITSLGKLEKVGGYLTLSHTPIEDLGNLTSVGSLRLSNTPIEDLGNLKSVGYNLNLKNTPIGKKLENSGMSEEEIKNKYGVKGELLI
jgi:hypothetical protein